MESDIETRGDMRWSHRYLRLYPHQLLILASANAAIPRHIITFSGTAVAEEGSNSVVVHSNSRLGGSKQFTLRFKTDSLKDKWLWQLQRALRRYNEVGPHS